MQVTVLSHVNGTEHYRGQPSRINEISSIHPSNGRKLGGPRRCFLTPQISVHWTEWWDYIQWGGLFLNSEARKPSLQPLQKVVIRWFVHQFYTSASFGKQKDNSWESNLSQLYMSVIFATKCLSRAQILSWLLPWVFGRLSYKFIHCCGEWTGKQRQASSRSILQGLRFLSLCKTLLKWVLKTLQNSVYRW